MSTKVFYPETLSFIQPSERFARLFDHGWIIDYINQDTTKRPELKQHRRHSDIPVSERHEIQLVNPKGWECHLIGFAIDWREEGIVGELSLLLNGSLITDKYLALFRSFGFASVEVV